MHFRTALAVTRTPPIEVSWPVHNCQFPVTSCQIADRVLLVTGSWQLVTVSDHPTTLQQILTPAVRIDWSQFEGMAALRCTVGVAIPLVIGLVLKQPSVAAFGAVGAVSVGFGSFQGAYRSRAALMLTAAAAMAISIFIGALAGHSSVATILIASLTAFISGLLVAVGPAAAFVGLQSCVAVLVAAGFPSRSGRSRARGGDRFWRRRDPDAPRCHDLAAPSFQCRTTDDRDGIPHTGFVRDQPAHYARCRARTAYICRTCATDSGSAAVRASE